MAQHSLGHAKKSHHALDELIAKFGEFDAYQVAEIHAWRGEKDRAFEWLERAYEVRDPGLSYLKFDQMLDKVRSDPRFTALLKRMNLPLD